MLISALLDLFLIEYDKDLISTYPSLTTTECYSMLDKAQSWVLKKKHDDLDSSSSFQELSPLLQTDDLTITGGDGNSVYADMTTTSSTLLWLNNVWLQHSETFDLANNYLSASLEAVTMVSRALIPYYKTSPTNLPYIERPIGCQIDNKVFVYFDAYRYTADDFQALKVEYFKAPTALSSSNASSTFVFADSVAYEIVQRAVLYAVESVESPRTATLKALDQ